MISKELNLRFQSLMNDLEALHLRAILDIWCKIRQNPYSTIGITKNYYVSPHVDSSDTKYSFILWLMILQSIQ